MFCVSGKVVNDFGEVLLFCSLVWFGIMKKNKDGSGGFVFVIIFDLRFVRVYMDFWFMCMLINKMKVLIDKCFLYMFLDKNFFDLLGVDKRGCVKKKKEKYML